MSVQTSPLTLSWLPANPHWQKELGILRANPAGCFSEFVRLARYRLDALETLQLDRAFRRHLDVHAPPAPAVRVAVLASSTVRHLLPSLRVAALRRGLVLEVYEAPYGQYMQELLDPASPLSAFRPKYVVLALDAHHLATLALDSVNDAIERLQQCWRRASDRFGATVIQQTALPIFAELLGSNEHRLPASAAGRVDALNRALRPAADAAGVHLLAVDQFVRWGGVDAWYSAALWNHGKQEVHPAAAPLWGDLLARVIAAQRGRSCKCLVLDLDNTLWGGVVGDDGPAGLAIGEGSATGEAHLALQNVCLDLRRRGVLLAVCSKNDDAVARAAFSERAEMPLALTHFASFHANWDDKATNLRAIANELRIGLDALVFFDDNPAERALIRQELPEVDVPELPDDPAGFGDVLSRAGYFESVALTGADLARADQYAADAARSELQGASMDMAGYLAGLAMRMRVTAFDEANLPRIVQLANKTNQFNLTTMRLSDSIVRGWIGDPARRTWRIELTDRFGDHGTVALLAGSLTGAAEFTLDLWLMSCRVLGREVEDACLTQVVADLRELGISGLVGLYRPSGRNSLVRQLYARLGFQLLDEVDDEVAPPTSVTDTVSTPEHPTIRPSPHMTERWLLEVSKATPHTSAIAIETSEHYTPSANHLIYPLDR